LQAAEHAVGIPRWPEVFNSDCQIASESDGSDEYSAEEGSFPHHLIDEK
jgi:hypothetical protein